MQARLALPILLVAGLWGCKAGPTHVWVDREALLQSDDQIIDSSVARLPGLSRSAKIDEMAGNITLTTASLEKLDEIRTKLADNRAKILDRVTNELVDAALARNRAEHKIASNNLRGEIGLIWTDYQDELRVLFESYAKQEGDLLIIVAMHAGVPYGEGEVLMKEGHPFYPYTKKSVKDAQAELVQLRSDYLAQSNMLFDAAIQRESTILGALDESYRIQREAMLNQAREEASELVAASLSEPYEIDLSSVFEILPVNDATASAAVDPLPQQIMQLVPENHDIALLEAELKVFAKEKGYTIVETKVGAVEKTEEFIQWREKYSLGQ